MTPSLLPPSLNVASPAATGASREPGTPAADAFDAQVADQFRTVANELHRSALFSTSVRDNLRQAADYSQSLMHSYQRAIEDISNKERTRDTQEFSPLDSLHADDRTAFMEGIRDGIREELQQQNIGITENERTVFMEGIREGVREELRSQGLPDEQVNDLMAVGDLRTVGMGTEAENFFAPLREALTEAIKGFESDLKRGRGSAVISDAASSARDVPDVVEEEISERRAQVEGRNTKKEKESGRRQHPGYDEAPMSEDLGSKRQHDDMDPDGDPTPHSKYSLNDWEDGRSWENIRGYSMERGNQWLSEWGGSQKPAVDDAGNFLDAAAGAKWEGQMARIGKVQGSLAAAGEGGMAEGAMSAVKGVGKGGAVAGAILLAVQKLYEVGMRETAAYHEERGQLRQSSTTGGREDMGDVIGERAKKFVNKRFSEEALFLGSDQAEQLYNNVTDMGLRGDERAEATDFAMEQFKRSGMSVDTSSALMQQTVDNGVTDFTQLAEAIDSVNESAAKGGVTLRDAQQDFALLYESISRNTTSGAGGASLASSIQAVSNNMGRQLSNVDFGESVIGRQAQYSYANRNGMTVGQVQADIARGGTDIAPAMIAEGIDRLNSVIFSKVGGISGAVEAMRDYIDAEGPFDTDEKRKELGLVALERGLYNLDHVASVASQLGVKIEGGDVALFVGTMLANVAGGKSAIDTSNPNQGNKKTGQFSENKKGKIDGKEIDKFGPGDVAVKTPGVLGWAAKAVNPMSWGKDGPVSEIALQPGRQTYQEKRLRGEFEDELDTDFEKAAWKAYADPTKTVSKDGKEVGGLVFRTGERDAAIESLFKADLSEDTKFKVKDAKGKQKEVNLNEAITMYSDQLSSGEAEISAGNQKGKKVGEVTDVWDPSGKVKKDKEKDEKGKQKVDVTVTAKGALNKFLTFNVGGDADVDDARAAGEAPRSLPNPLNLPGWIL